MSYPKIAKIIIKLLARTQAGHLKWEETATAGSFQAAFPGYAVNMSFEKSANTTDYTLRIMDEEGKVVEEVSDPELQEDFENSYGTMSELYAVARRSALGVEDALNKILKSLEENDVPF